MLCLLYWFQYCYVTTIIIVVVLLKWNNIIFAQIGHGYRNIHCEGIMLLEKECMVLLHDKIAYGKDYCYCYIYGCLIEWWLCFWIRNIAYNNMSAISWWSVLLLKEAGMRRWNRRRVACLSQTLSQVVSNSLRQERQSNPNVMVIGVVLTGR